MENKRLTAAEEQGLLSTLHMEDAKIVYKNDYTLLDLKVPAGVPTGLGDETAEYRQAVQKVLSCGAHLLVNVCGQSMTGAGIDNGDQVELRLQDYAVSGDIVVAWLDEQVTVKTYYEDEEGDHWLVPENPRFEPIHMADYESGHIVGKVVRIIKGDVPHGNASNAGRRVREARQQVQLPPSRQRIAQALHRVLELIRNRRQWFAIYSVLYHLAAVGGYQDFQQLLDDIMGEASPRLDLDDLRRMEVLSFTRPSAQWDEANAPVSGSRFTAYHTIATRFSQLLAGA